jgi:tight adherence protein B
VTELVHALLVLEAMVVTFLVATTIGRWLLMRRAVVSRSARFVGSTPATRSAGPGPELERILAARLSRLTPVQHVSLLLIFLAVTLLIFGGFVLRGLQSALLALVLLAVAAWLPRREAARRREQLEAQLVPALHTMAAAIETGYSVQQALDRIAHDLPRPISDEFAQVLRAVELGVSLDSALAALATRSEHFELFATIVAVQHRVGGDMPSLLFNLASHIQERRQFRAETRALTAQARFSGWVLVALPFGVLGVVSLVSPAYVGLLFTAEAGRAMLAVATALLAIGLIGIRAISHVEI